MVDTSCTTFQLNRDVIGDMGVDSESVPEPRPAHASLPPWYRFLQVRHDHGGLGTTTVKMCRPFGDALKLGFVVPYPERVSCSLTDDGLDVDASVGSAYGDGTVRSLGAPQSNSEFRVPQVKLELPWEIRTPPGYRTLVTFPLNRAHSGIKPYSLLVDATEDFTELTVPARVYGEQVSVAKGEPMVQVVVFHEDAILDEFETGNFADDPELDREHERHHRLTNARMDFYRTECWVKKAKSSVSREPPRQVERRTEFPEDTVEFYTKDEHFDSSHPPVDSRELIPESYADAVAESGVSERVRDQLLDAMDLGFVTRTTGDSTVTQTDGEIDVTTEYSEQVVYKMNDVKLGEKLDGADVRLFSIREQWVPVVPDGYSVLFTEPMNHCQTRYRGYAGLSDADNYLKTANQPGTMAISDGETITIRDEAPVGQLIPIHRDGILTKATIADREP